MPPKQHPQNPEIPDLTLLLQKEAQIDAHLAQANDTTLPYEEARHHLTETKRLKVELEIELAKVSEKLVSPLERALNLKEQYESQVKILEDTGILQELKNGSLGIIDIEGNESPIPTYEEVKKRVKENKEILETKVAQGFTELQLTPFGMSLDALHKKVGENILKHYVGMQDPNDPTKRIPNPNKTTLFATKKDQNDPNEALVPLPLDETTPLWIWEDGYKNADKNGTLVYEPKLFDKTNHQGKTKQEIISTTGSWQISFLENLPNLPVEGKGEMKKGRKQLEAKKTPIDYLKTLQTDPQYANEHGITPEDWTIYFLTHLEKTNQVIDDWQGNGKISWNLGGYFPESSVVPNAYWGRGDRQANAGCGDGGFADSDFGARARVRI